MFTGKEEGRDSQSISHLVALFYDPMNRRNFGASGKPEVCGTCQNRLVEEEEEEGNDNGAEGTVLNHLWMIFVCVLLREPVSF